MDPKSKTYTTTIAALELEDGRNSRGKKTRLRILKAARAIIDKQKRLPHMHEVALLSGHALRTVYHHYPSSQALTEHALALEPARELTVTYKPNRNPETF